MLAFKSISLSKQERRIWSSCIRKVSDWMRGRVRISKNTRSRKRCRIYNVKIVLTLEAPPPPKKNNNSRIEITDIRSNVNVVKITALLVSSRILRRDLLPLNLQRSMTAGSLLCTCICLYMYTCVFLIS